MKERERVRRTELERVKERERVRRTELEREREKQEKSFFKYPVKIKQKHVKLNKSEIFNDASFLSEEYIFSIARARIENRERARESERKQS